VELTDVDRVFNPATVQYTFLSAAHGTFSKLGILGHKSSFNKYKKTEITPCILSDHNEINVELSNKSSSRKYSNNWRLNNTLLNNQCITEEIWEKKSSSWNLMKMKTEPARTYGIQQRQSYEESL
jgi:hypothetical protein